MGQLPRTLSPNLLWTGRCIDFEYQGKPIHSHISAYLVKGSEKTLIVDTGAPAHWPSVYADIRAFLGGRPLDYVFPTHPEFPHGGALPHLLEAFPEATAVGDLRDHALYYPELRSRFAPTAPGDMVDLGDRKILFLPALWRDLPTTQWAFETTDRILFVSDAFAFLHSHVQGRCDELTSEQPPIKLELMQHFNERALYWTRFTDVSRSFPDFDEMIRRLQPRLIAPGHGNVVDTLAMAEAVKQGMTVRSH